MPVVAQQRDALAQASSSGSRDRSHRIGGGRHRPVPAAQGVQRPGQHPDGGEHAATGGRHRVGAGRGTSEPGSGALGLAVAAGGLARWPTSAARSTTPCPRRSWPAPPWPTRPGLLGAQGDRNYLILFTNPAESRFLGGFTGSFGILTAHQGKVSFTVGDRISPLFPGPKAAQLVVSGEAEFMRRYARYDPAHNLQNLTVSPDLPTDATVTRSLFKQYYGSDLDGIVVVDPYGLAALLKLTGPVQVEGLAQPLTADNAAAVPRLPAVRDLRERQGRPQGHPVRGRASHLQGAHHPRPARPGRGRPGAGAGGGAGPAALLPLRPTRPAAVRPHRDLGPVRARHQGRLPLPAVRQRQPQQDRLAC